MRHTSLVEPVLANLQQDARRLGGAQGVFGETAQFSVVLQCDQPANQGALTPPAQSAGRLLRFAPLDAAAPACRHAERITTTVTKNSNRNTALPRPERCPRGKNYALLTRRKPKLPPRSEGSLLLRRAPRKFDSSSYHQLPPRPTRRVPSDGPPGFRDASGYV